MPDTQPLRRLLDPGRPLTYGIVQAGENVSDGVPYIRPVDMTPAAGVASPQALLRTSPEIAAQYKRSEVREGDIVLSIGPSYGKVMIVPAGLSGANLTQGTARLAPGEYLDPGWMYWFLQSQFARDHWDLCVSGATFSALNLGPLGETPVPVLLLSRQRQIADFLDDHVARIDNTLAARRRQLDLLDEALLAEMARHLTGGASRTDGVETGLGWLPHIPRTWSLGPVFAFYDVRLGKMLNQEHAAGQHQRPYLRNANVHWFEIDTEDMAQMSFEPHERMRYLLRSGDLMVCEGGAGVGQAAIWRGQITECYYQKSLHRVRSTSYLEPEWLMYWLRVATASGVLASGGNLATIPHLTGEQLREYRIPIPARGEGALAELHSQLEQTEIFRQAVERGIELLRELKRSLITAAVTGEFDVSSADGSRVPV